MIEVETLKPAEGSHNLAATDARFADTWTKLRYVNPGHPKTVELRVNFPSFCRAFELVEYDARLIYTPLAQMRNLISGVL